MVLPQSFLFIWKISLWKERYNSGETGRETDKTKARKKGDCILLSSNVPDTFQVTRSPPSTKSF